MPTQVALPITKLKVFANATPMLFFVCLLGSIGEMTYGYDTASFGGVQAIPSFKRQFGTCNAAGVCALDTSTTALLNSIASLGKFAATFIVGDFVERFGHRWGMFVMVMLNYIGAILEITAKVPAQFAVGRVIVYASIAFLEVSVTTYQVEIVPANMRGVIVSALQLFTTMGGLVATGVNKAYSTGTDAASWQIPVAITFLAPTVLLLGLPFIPDAPRWLLYRGRREDAIKTLKRVRPQSHIDTGMCDAEIEAIEEALQSRPHKGSFASLFRGTNRRRTGLVLTSMCFQQLTGQAFVSQYQTVFFVSVGLADKAFTYPVISSAISIIPCFMGMYALDKLGRRPVFIFGGFFMALWMFLVAGLGGSTGGTGSAVNGVVASFMMFGFAFSGTWAPAPYALAAEVPANDIREKTMAMGAAIQALAGWLVSFVLPYMLNAPYAALGPRVGYIFGAICCLISVYAIFFIPETRGRSLEELEELFEAHVPAWRFSTTKTHGAARRVAALQRNEDIGEEKLAIEHHELGTIGSEHGETEDKV